MYMRGSVNMWGSMYMRGSVNMWGLCTCRGLNVVCFVVALMLVDFDEPVKFSHRHGIAW